MMNDIAVIIYFVGTSFFIIPAQCADASTLSQIVSSNFETANFNRSTPPTQPSEPSKIVSQRQGGNNVSTPTNSSLSTTDVFALYSNSDQKVFTSISPTEKLQNNATDNYTQTSMPAKSNTPTMLPISPSRPAVTPLLGATAESTKETNSVAGQGKALKSGAVVAIIIVVVVMIIIIIIVVLAIFNKKGKMATYYTDSNHESAVPMNQVGTETPKE
uniref:uncharacterized protein isoform X1 n=1 Tax=Pristiophorus japonicus TaxID=55135 RepID=UPI00398EE855